VREGPVRAGVRNEDFFRLLNAYYLSDAGSYTKDAGAKPSLDHLFEFDRKRGVAKYNPEVQEKMDDLRAAVSR
jgi:hypothetical protein